MKKLTIEKQFETYSVEFKNIDVSLEQLFDSLRGLLIAYGWTPESIDDYIVEWSEEIKGLRGVDEEDVVVNDWTLLDNNTPERISFYVRYCNEFTEDLYNELMNWCEQNSKGKLRGFDDTYQGLKLHGYFVFDNWGTNSYTYDENCYHYGVDNNKQGCLLESTVEEIKKLIGYVD